MDKVQEIEKLKKEYNDLIFMAECLEYEHQESLKLELLSKASNLQEIVKELEDLR